MIQKRTLFILGAGASYPYGMPLGSRLRQEICELTTENGVSEALISSGVDRQQLNAFAEEFKRSRQQSIDTFLSKRAELAPLGKKCIAAILCSKEQEQALFSITHSDDWYGALWNAMQNDCHAASGITQNAVRFATFNYDRSLEAFLHHSIKHSYGVNDEQAELVWSRLPIVHFYGCLGPYSNIPKAGSRMYSHSFNAAQLCIAAESLRVIPDVERSDEGFMVVRQWMEWAETICILGFGFDPLNMERLGIDSVLDFIKERGRPVPTVIASTLGFTQNEQARISSRYFGYGSSWKPYNETNLGTLRQSGILHV